MPAMDVYRALWRYRYMIVALTAIGTVFAYYLSSTQTKEYRASTLVRIQQKAANPGEAYTSLAVGEQLAKTYAQIVTTRSVKERIGQGLGGGLSARDVNISASPVQDLALLHISATSQDPRVAATVANAAPGVLRNFIAETQTINDQIVTINQASIPGTPVSPKPMRTAILAFLVILIFNCGLALLIEFFRDRLPEVEELESAIGKPVLGTIPVLTFKAMTLDRPADLERLRRVGSPPPTTQSSGAIRRPSREQGVEGIG
jgi:capsular polysaccharide biosynthesis protein